jgi:hypothetical protein
MAGMKDMICADIVERGGLSVVDGLAALRAGEMRVVQRQPAGGVDWPELRFRGQWWSVARTDWKDDVCTGLAETLTAEQWREYCVWKLERAYGVRLTDSAIGHKTFAIVDAYSDG